MRITVAGALQRLQPALSRLGGFAQIVALATMIGVVNAQEVRDASAVVDLVHDAGTGALLKAHSRALYRSPDGGETWQSVPFPPSVADGSITTVRTPVERDGTVYVSGPGLGVLRSDDGGGRWVSVSEALPSQNVVALATHATQPDTLYAYVPENGIYRSQDAGKTWRMMDKGPEGIRQLIHSNMEGSMESGWLYAATADGAQISMDCFCLWRESEELGGTIEDITYDPRQPERMFAATERGLFRSRTGGRDWEEVPVPDSALTAVTVTPAGVLYGATTDGQIFRSSDSAETWEQVGG